jgi:type II secretory pathway pseudopilin PulG
MERTRGAAGFSLLEVVIALSILMVVSLGLLPLGLVAVATTENQGHLAARTAEYSSDKMEQLLALAFNDATTDTRVFPAAATGGSGLAVGGSANPAAPAALYVDYLDVEGHLIPSTGTVAPAGWFYRRVWQVTSPFANMKQVTVTTTVERGYPVGRTPQATITALKTLPF